MDWFLYDIGLRHERVKTDLEEFNVKSGHRCTLSN